MVPMSVMSAQRRAEDYWVRGENGQITLIRLRLTCLATSGKSLGHSVPPLPHL